MKLSVSKQDFLSTVFVVIACAAALLTTGATKASAKILKIRNSFSCSQGSCHIGGGSCITVGTGGFCACNTQMGQCIATN